MSERKQPDVTTYETTAYPVTGKLFGAEKKVVTMQIATEYVEFLGNEPGKHTFIEMAGKVLLVPGVLRSNN